MIVKIDVREHDLVQQINQLIINIPIFKNIIVKSEVLPIGDIIISNEKEETSDPVKTSEKDYVSVIKKVKKENITTENIDEIMLCQIPGISAVTALTIIEKYKTIINLIKELEMNQDCLKNISCTNVKGQSRKISKTSIANIVKFLLKK